MNSRTPQESEVIQSLLDEILDDLLTFVDQSLFPKMDVLQCNIIKQVEFLAFLDLYCLRQFLLLSTNISSRKFLVSSLKSRPTCDF